MYAEEKYTEENDDLDIEGVIKDADTMKAFTGCFMDTADCDHVSGDFKKDLPEAIQTACAKCTDKQKHITKRYFEGLEEKYPELYQAFKNKYDPENKYFAALKAAIAKF